MAKFDPFLSLDCTCTPSTLAQSKERKGSNLAIWQPLSVCLPPPPSPPSLPPLHVSLYTHTLYHSAGPLAQSGSQTWATEEGFRLDLLTTDDSCRVNGNGAVAATVVVAGELGHVLGPSAHSAAAPFPMLLFLLFLLFLASYTVEE